MADKEKRILCIETDEKIIECGYGDFYNTKIKKNIYANLERILYVNGVQASEKRYVAELILQYLLSTGE